MANARAIQRESAYRQLRPMLLHGQIPGGTRLGEVEWAGRLGVHRAALREAFSLLTHEGLLVRGERGGHFAPVFEKADLDEVLELRAALEVAAIYRLERFGEPVDVDSLRMICQMMWQMKDAGMALAFADADRRFHERIIELGGNQRMARVYLQAPVFITVRLDFVDERALEHMTQTIIEHEQICDELEAERFGVAAHCLEQHLLSAHSSAASGPLITTRPKGRQNRMDIGND